jgi:CRP/FNR family transcriptional regulator, cyclic AMP receptor protein
MKAKIELLRQVPLFADWSRDELRAVAAVADELDVPAGKELTLEGAAGREFIVLVEGEAIVHEDGEAVATLTGGDFLGEIALLTRRTRTATVTTTVPSRLLVLTDRAFRQLAETVPAFAARTWAATAERLPG